MILTLFALGGAQCTGTTTIGLKTQEKNQKSNHKWMTDLPFCQLWLPISSKRKGIAY